MDEYLDDLLCTTDYTVHTDKQAIKSLKKIIEYIAPFRHLDKEEVKKEICEYIDIWFT